VHTGNTAAAALAPTTNQRRPSLTHDMWKFQATPRLRSYQPWEFHVANDICPLLGYISRAQATYQV